MTKKPFGLQLVLISLGLITLGSIALAGRNLITTPAGCNQEFRGNKGAIASCTSCVRGHGKFKKSLKGGWSCQ